MHTRNNEIFQCNRIFFRKTLARGFKNVPIGLISSNWGGTPAEIWTPEEVIQNDPILLESAKTRKEES